MIDCKRCPIHSDRCSEFNIGFEWDVTGRELAKDQLKNRIPDKRTELEQRIDQIEHCIKGITAYLADEDIPN